MTQHLEDVLDEHSLGDEMVTSVLMKIVGVQSGIEVPVEIKWFTHAGPFVEELAGSVSKRHCLIVWLLSKSLTEICLNFVKSPDFQKILEFHLFLRL